MALRTDIQAIVVNNKHNPERTAFVICEMLENTIGLACNGWFEDDPEMLEWLEASQLPG